MSYGQKVVSILRNGTERNPGLFHGTGKCDHGMINLKLEDLTRNGYYYNIILSLAIYTHTFNLNTERILYLTEQTSDDRGP